MSFSWWMFFYSHRQLFPLAEELEAWSRLQTKAESYNLYSRSVGETRKGVWSTTVHCGYAKVLPRGWPGPQWNTSESLVPESKNQMEETEFRIWSQSREKQIWEKRRRKKSVETVYFRYLMNKAESANAVCEKLSCLQKPECHYEVYWCEWRQRLRETKQRLPNIAVINWVSKIP